MGKRIQRTWTSIDGRLTRKEKKAKDEATPTRRSTRSRRKAAASEASGKKESKHSPKAAKDKTTGHKLAKRTWTMTEPDGTKGKRLHRRTSFNVGRHVRIFDPKDKTWQHGKIIAYRPRSGESQILYYDDTFEWLDVEGLHEDHKVSIHTKPNELMGTVVQFKTSKRQADWTSAIVVGFSKKKGQSKIQMVRDGSVQWIDLEELDSKNLVHYQPPDALKTPGTKVQLFWPDDGKWYKGTIVMYHEDGDSKILYDDGSFEYINLDNLHEDHQLHYLPADVCQGANKHFVPGEQPVNKWIGAHKSMYIQIKGKRYDRGMLKVASEAEEAHGKIGMGHAQRLVEEVVDGGKYSDIEKETMKYIRRRYEFTDEADEFVRLQIARFVAKKNFKLPPGKKSKDGQKSKAARKRKRGKSSKTEEGKADETESKAVDLKEEIKSWTTKLLEKAFAFCDEDKSGFLEPSEVEKLVKASMRLEAKMMEIQMMQVTAAEQKAILANQKAQLENPSAQLLGERKEMLIKGLDEDHDGKISLQEMKKLFDQSLAPLEAADDSQINETFFIGYMNIILFTFQYLGLIPAKWMQEYVFPKDSKSYKAVVEFCEALLVGLEKVIWEPPTLAMYEYFT